MDSSAAPSNLKRKRRQSDNRKLTTEQQQPGSLLNVSTSTPNDAVVGLGISSPLDDADTGSAAMPSKRRRLAGEPASRSQAAARPSTPDRPESHSIIGASDMAHPAKDHSVTAQVGDAKPLEESATPKIDTELEHLKETITANLSTRILYKHNELRLIDQEIAKCQVALEQLRRCSEIPYPSLTGMTADMINVSTGSGPALMLPRQPHPAVSPAPWGVADGPYTRHYAQWLLPDSIFDGGVAARNISTAQTALENAARARAPPMGAEPVLTSSRSRAHRGSSHTILQSLPSGYAQPKPERAAQVIKRQADGMFVKLVCPGIGCGEERFNSVQGFINHCRIKHQIHFQTHEDAAQRAGTIEGVDQKMGAMADVVQSQPQDTIPSVMAKLANLPLDQSTSHDTGASLHEFALSDRRSSTDTIKPASPTTFRTPSIPGATSQASEQRPLFGSNFAHQYNKPGLDPVREWPAHRDKGSPPLSPYQIAGERQRRQSNMGPPISPAFVSSDQLPFLSEHFANSGKSANLQEMVDEARDRFDLDDVIVPEDIMETDSAPHDGSRSRIPSAHGTVGGLGAPLMDRRPGSKKGLPSSRAGPESDNKDHDSAPFLSVTRSRRHRRDDPSNQLTAEDPISRLAEPPSTPRFPSSFVTSVSPVELSPGAHNATDTNQAPSLVSDDGQSGSEYEDDDNDDGEEGGPSNARGSDKIGSDFDFGDSDKILTDSSGPSSLAMDVGLGRWDKHSKSSRRSQRAA